MAQGDDHGCAIACVAMICGLTYERCRAEFFPRRTKFKDDKTMMVNADQMMRVIRRLGYSCIHVDGSFKQHKLPAIVLFDWRTVPESTHAVVWDPFRSTFLDPGYDWPMSSELYMKNWRRSNYASIVVTGRRKQ